MEVVVNGSSWPKVALNSPIKSGGDCPDCRIDPGQRRFCCSGPAYPATSGALAARGGRSAGERRALNTWRDRPAHRTPGGAGARATPAPFSITREQSSVIVTLMATPPCVTGHATVAQPSSRHPQQAHRARRPPTGADSYWPAAFETIAGRTHSERRSFPLHVPG